MTMPTSRARVDVGMPAPDFVLNRDGGRNVTLSDLRGQPVILAFYSAGLGSLPRRPARTLQLARAPGAGCERGAAGHLDGRDVVPARVPADSVTRAAARRPRPHGAVADRYDVRGGQALFVVDADGDDRMAARWSGGSVPNTSELLAALAALATRPPKLSP